MRVVTLKENYLLPLITVKLYTYINKMILKINKINTEFLNLAKDRSSRQIQEMFRSKLDRSSKVMGIML